MPRWNGTDKTRVLEREDLARCLANSAKVRRETAVVPMKITPGERLS